jgi:transposase
MANQRIPMFQVKRIIQLRVANKSKRSIAQILGISRNTLDGYLQKLSCVNSDLPSFQSWTEEQLVKLLASPVDNLNPHWS